MVLENDVTAILAEPGTHGHELLHKPCSIDESSRVLRKLSKPAVSS